MLNTIHHGTPSPTPLIIAHGLYGSARNWGVISKRLSDTRYVIAVDMRNHGASDWTKTHSYNDLAEDLAEVIAPYGQADVLGHSMGGKAAMMLALTAPERVNRLIVGDIAPVAYTHSQMPMLEAMRGVDLSVVRKRSDAAEQLGALGVEPALQSFFTQSLDIKNAKWLLNLDTLAEEMPKIMDFPDISTSFPNRTLFLTGAESDYVQPKDRPRIRELFPAARFVKLKDAGHWLHADQPRGFEAAVRAFLDA
ncbi:MAG: alpha/beta fold hydrolase [Paracoccaceae bacterium]